MNDHEEAEKIERHQAEFAEYMEFYLTEDLFNLKTVNTVVNGHRCNLEINSEQQIYDIFDESTIMDTLFDRAFNNFSTRQYFTDRDGFDFGCAYVWENPSIAINGSNHNYRVKQLIVIEALEEGHHNEYQIFIKI